MMAAGSVRDKWVRDGKFLDCKCWLVLTGMRVVGGDKALNLILAGLQNTAYECAFFTFASKPLKGIVVQRLCNLLRGIGEIRVIAFRGAGIMAKIVGE